MIVRICDIAYGAAGKSATRNIRRVEADDIKDDNPGKGGGWAQHNVVFYVDPVSKTATVKPMWLKNVRDAE